MLKIKDKTIVKSKVKVKDKKEVVKSDEVKVEVKSPDILFKEELLSQVKEMRDIFENTLTEMSEVKVLLKSLQERFVWMADQ